MKEKFWIRRESERRKQKKEKKKKKAKMMKRRERREREMKMEMNKKEGQSGPRRLKLHGTPSTPETKSTFCLPSPPPPPHNTKRSFFND